VAEAKKAGDVQVKVILETCYLAPDQIAQACQLAREAGADYVKTSTGFGDGPATPEAIQIMIDTVGETMGVKASGGVRSYETACGYLDQGCRRLGAAGGTPTILQDAPEE
jgi:deoxyribose-phosphate aldolase